MSGGMRQRAMIAMALACNPVLLIADEPTTALDVTIQAQILELMRDLQARTGAAILLITHNLGVVAEMADRVIVMYLGQVVEDAGVQPIFDEPLHPYTRGLIASIPFPGRKSLLGKRPLEEIMGMVPSMYDLPQGCYFHPRCKISRDKCRLESPELFELNGNHQWPAGRPRTMDMNAPNQPILAVTDLKKYFPVKKGIFKKTVGRVHAVNGVSFEIKPGESLGLVGESGCGKTTLGKCVNFLIRPTAGRVVFDGVKLNGLDDQSLKRIRPRFQMIFQDPYSTLNPRMSVESMLAEPVKLFEKRNSAQCRERVRELLNIVGLRPEHASRYPHEFSGGQRNVWQWPAPWPSTRR